MSLFLIGALAFNLQFTPANLGYDLFQFGVCEEAGWAVDQDGMSSLIIERMSSSGLSDAEFEEALNDGGTDAGVEFQATINAITTQAQARAFEAAMVERCDALTATYPEILSRTSETAATWNARMQGFIARYPE